MTAPLRPRPEPGAADLSPIGRALDALVGRAATDEAAFLNELATFVAALTNARGVSLLPETPEDATPITRGLPPGGKADAAAARQAFAAPGVVALSSVHLAVAVDVAPERRAALSVTLPPGNSVLGALAQERLDLVRTVCRLRVQGGGSGVLSPAIIRAAAEVAAGRWDAAQSLVDALAPALAARSVALVALSGRKATRLVLSGHETLATRSPERARLLTRAEAALTDTEEVRERAKNDAAPLGGHRPGYVLVVDSDQPRAVATAAIALDPIFAGSAAGRPRLKLPVRSLRTIGIVGALAGIAMIPIGDGVNLPATVAAIEHRIVTAPFDGRIARVAVEPGDAVVAGTTVLFEMDTSALVLERAEAQARRTAALVEREAARAARDAATVRQAEIALERADLRISALDVQIADAVQTAPITGRIAGEDLDSLRGSFVGLGTDVVRVLDPGTLRLDIAISPRARGRIEDAATGVFRPDAAPADATPFTIDRISAAPDTRVAEITYPATSEPLSPAPDTEPLRPGMAGVARIAFDDAPLGLVAWRRIRDWALLTFWL